MTRMDSADSDEDYVAEVDEVGGQSDELDSLVADDLEEDSTFVEDDDEEEEEEEWRTVKPRAKRVATMSRKNRAQRVEGDKEVKKGEDGCRNGVRSRNQKGYARSGKTRLKRVEEEEEQEEVGEKVENEGGWRTVVKPRVCMGPTRSRKNGAKRPKKRRKLIRDDSEASDDDDEEFTLDDFDPMEEEEDVTFPSLKTNKRGKTMWKRKSPGKSERRKTSVNAVKKSLQQKSKRTRSLKREECGDDEDFIDRGPSLRTRKSRGLKREECCDDKALSDKGPVLRTRHKKKPVHRNKRVLTDGTDSDSFTDSSDCEFTISEEEQEQVRKANQICRSLKRNSRSTRRIEEDETLCKLSKPSIKKGKEKAEETKNDVGNSVCGICLTEEGKNSIRGTLNCCSHFFCFACIMEWSKVESRCPVCKQRFITISKPARCARGFDLRNVIIQVPERDQVYQPSEEELREFLNPYDNVICTECQQGGDDALMLLCDICDSPAHTYCVGLGTVVPEGNWYCDVCRPATLGSSHSQTEFLTPDRRQNTDASAGPSTYENMAEIDLNVTIPEIPISQENWFPPSPRFSGRSSQALSPVCRMGVSTVSGRRRRIQNRILNMLSERASQAPQADPSFLHPLLGRANSTFQQSQTTDIGNSYHTQHIDRLHEGPSHTVQNRDYFLGRMAQMVGDIVASTSSDGSVQRNVQISGMNMTDTRSTFSIHSSHKSDEYLDNRQRVHSVVRRELKSLSRDMNLGHDSYAEISRRSVDTVMVACGLEPRRSDVYQVQRPVCLHVERADNVTSSPMSGCCESCFENFVKDVMSRVMDITLGPHWMILRH